LEAYPVPPRAGRNTIAFLAQHNTKPDGIFASEEEVVRAALADPNVQRHTQGKTVRKTIYAQKRILNIVVG
jgi:leucyl-tRNA synthetase